MKIRSSASRSAANVLIVTLFVTAAMGIVLVSYLTMINSQRNMTARSEAWNRALMLAESGIEEALAHLNANATNVVNLGSQGWVLTGGLFTMRRDFADGYYEASILSGANPVLTSIGYAIAPGNYASASGPFLAAAGNGGGSILYTVRKVEVQCESKGPFSKAIVARDKIVLNGKDVFTDSYHSYDSTSSTNDGSGVAWGQYDFSKRRDRGDIAVIEGMSDDLNVSAAKVRGRAATGADGDINLKGNAAIGDNAWIDGGNIGIKPGWSSSDANFALPSVVVPFTVAFAMNTTGGWVGTNFYNVILSDGDWKVGKLEKKVLVTGNARLIVTDSIAFDADPNKLAGIEFDPDARLEIYADCKDVKMTGKKGKKNVISARMGLNAGGNATNMFLFGTDKCEHIELSNMDTFCGVVYAPTAEVKLKSGSPKYYHADVFGAIMGLRVILEKNATFHYDENVANIAGFRQYVIKSWREL